MVLFADANELQNAVSTHLRLPLSTSTTTNGAAAEFGDNHDNADDDDEFIQAPCLDNVSSSSSDALLSSLVNTTAATMVARRKNLLVALRVRCRTEALLPPARLESLILQVKFRLAISWPGAKNRLDFIQAVSAQLSRCSHNIDLQTDLRRNVSLIQVTKCNIRLLTYFLLVF